MCVQTTKKGISTNKAKRKKGKKINNLFGLGIKLYAGINRIRKEDGQFNK